jgi:hypothetical protein
MKTTNCLCFLFFSIFFFQRSPVALSQNAFLDAEFYTENLWKFERMREFTLKGIKELEKIPTPSEKEAKSLQTLKRFEVIYKGISRPTVRENTLLERAQNAQMNLDSTKKILDDLKIIPAEVLSAYGLNSKRNAERADGGGNSSGELMRIPSLNFLSPSTFVDGAALFLKKRVKEELAVAFLNQFRKTLRNDTLFKRLAPSTFLTLETLLQLDENLPSINSLALNSFQSDISSLPEHIEDALLNDPFFAEARKDTDFVLLTLPFGIVKNVRRGAHPAAVIEDLGQTHFNKSGEIDQVLRMMSLLNLSLRDKVTSEAETSLSSVWVDVRRWSALKRKGGDRFFLRRLYEENRAEFAQISMPKIDSSLEILSQNIGDYLQALNSFDAYYMLMTASGARERDSLALEMAWSMVQLTEKTQKIHEQIFKQKTSEKSKTWQFFGTVATSTLKTVKAVREGNYAMATFESYQILRKIKFRNQEPQEQDFSLGRLNTFFYYANFMSDVLVASGSEAVATVLDQYAAPVGSYAVKRRAAFSISLNAYPGLYVGNEILARKAADSLGIARSSFTSGVTAPMGLAFTWGNLGGFSNHEKRRQSLSVFIPIVDIGAVLSYRWANDRARGLPQAVEWAQVLSTGIHVSYGWNGLPIATSVGWQLAPKLRQLGAVGNSNNNENVHRFFVATTVDITIFNLYKKAKRRR